MEIKRITCPKCEGSGKVDGGKDCYCYNDHHWLLDCNACGGTGRKQKTCPACDGDGYLET